MNFIKFLCLFTILTSFNVKALDSYESSFEDTPEFLAPDDVEAPLPAETWSYVFELVNPNGTTRVLNFQNHSTLLKPASTMKLFTGWWAFQKNHRSDDYLAKMLKESVNSMAENTLQSMGGVLAMEDYFKEMGMNLHERNFVAADGSGLSYENKTTCLVETILLKKINLSKRYNRFKKLLAEPQQEGTLRTRLASLTGKVFAKTGTLARTAALSGFLETPKGVVVFCVMADYLRSDLLSARKKIDDMVIETHSSLE